MNENNKESKPQWKGCIIFGIINIVFVLLCTKLNIVMLSVALILLIAAGVVTTIQSIKEDWQEGFKVSVHLLNSSTLHATTTHKLSWHLSYTERISQKETHTAIFGIF